MKTVRFRHHITHSYILNRLSSHELTDQKSKERKTAPSKKKADRIPFEKSKSKKSTPVIARINIIWYYFVTYSLPYIILLTFSTPFFFLSRIYVLPFKEHRCFCCYWFLFLLQTLAIKCVILNCEEQPFVIRCTFAFTWNEWVMPTKRNDG